MDIPRRNQQGTALIIALVIVLLVLLVLVLMKLRNNSVQSPATESTSQAEQTKTEPEQPDETTTRNTGTATLSITQKARNVARKNDALRLAAATWEFGANNLGQMPTGFEDGRLAGGDPAIEIPEVGFVHYKTATVASGDHSAVSKDEIILVTGADCGENGETVASTSRTAAVLYAMESAGGQWDAVCTSV